MDIKTFIIDWLEISNSYNTENYLAKYLEDAVLDDPSVGRKFVGHKEILEYYTSYFIDYKTQTELVMLDIQDNNAHIEVEFTGEFPEEKIEGSFYFTFKNGKIATLIADLK